VRAAWPAIRNVCKAWLLLFGLCAALGALGWWLSGYRIASVFVFCGLLLGVAAYWYADRVAMGMVGARELLPGEAPALHSTV
jgi:heat shock protein HtpX